MIKMILTLALSLVVILNVNAANNVKNDKKIDAKCHIELYGGQQTIYFATVQGSHLSKLVRRLSNRSIPTVFSQKKQKVYKVYECVKLSDKFSSIQGRKIFAKHPR
jgi:hypothetical protein